MVRRAFYLSVKSFPGRERCLPQISFPMLHPRFSIASCAFAFVVVFGFVPDAQAQWQSGAASPASGADYNPDADANGTIHTPDLMQLLTVFGSEFEPVGCQHVDPSATNEALQKEVDLLQEQLAQQQNLINQIISHLQGQDSVDGPFFFDPTQGAWVATAPIIIENTMTAGRVRTGRLESGSAHFGGSVVVGDPD